MFVSQRLSLLDASVFEIGLCDSWKNQNQSECNQSEVHIVTVSNFREEKPLYYYIILYCIIIMALLYYANFRFFVFDLEPLQSILLS